MALKIAERGIVPPFIVMDVMQAAADLEAKGRHVLHLEVGQPGTPAPAPVREAAKAALDGHRLGYTLALGIDPLRARIARFYGERYDIDLDPARVVITVGSSGAFLLAFLSAFAAGDRVALGYPAYPAYRHILKTLGLRAVGLATDAVIVHPVFSIDDAWGDTVELLWSPRDESSLRQALFAPVAAIATPVVFATDWVWRSLWAIDPRDEEDA